MKLEEENYLLHLDTSDQPYIIELLIYLADVLSSSDYIYFNDKLKECNMYMPYTLVNYILYIFSIFQDGKEPPYFKKFLGVKYN